MLEAAQPPSDRTLAKKRHASSRHDAAHLEVRKRDIGHGCEQRLFFGLVNEILSIMEAGREIVLEEGRPGHAPVSHETGEALPTARPPASDAPDGNTGIGAALFIRRTFRRHGGSRTTRLNSTPSRSTIRSIACQRRRHSPRGGSRQRRVSCTL